MPKTVLVVDDSAMMRKVVINNLNAAGLVVNVLESHNGQDALDKFKSGGIDCVLSDWNMPVMDGITLVREIRKCDPAKLVPIIMITTEGSPDKVKEAVLAGANNYLVKPFTPERFKEKLSKVLA